MNGVWTSVVMRHGRQSLALAALALPLCGYAQIYSCRDTHGRYISSDHPLPECASVSVNELTKEGLVRRELPAPLTLEQKRQKELADEQRRAAQAQEDLRAQQDRALLARYHSEEDVEVARKYYLGLSQDLIKRDQMAIGNSQSDLQAAMSEAQFYKDKTALPLQLRNRISNAKRDLAQATQSMAGHQKDLSEVNGKFDMTLARYRQIAEPPEKR